MKNVIAWMIACLFFLQIPLANAVRVTGLYQASIPVASQADDLRDVAIQEGFLQVLIKLTGDPNITQNNEIAPYLARAAYYVQEYSYSSPSTSASQYILQIKYEKDDVNRLLKRAGFTYWGERRPLVLVLLTGHDAANNAEIAGGDGTQGILNIVKQQSNKFGLPVIFPLMDVDDMSDISTEDITKLDISRLDSLAKRYAPDAMLVGTIVHHDQIYTGSWHLLLGKLHWAWQTNDKTQADLISHMVYQVNQTLAKNYVTKTTTATPDTWLKLEINDVSQRGDLTNLMQYLQQVDAVQQVQLAQVTGNTVTLSVLIKGNVTVFQQNIAIGQHLILQAQDQETNKLIYKWAR